MWMNRHLEITYDGQLFVSALNSHNANKSKKYRVAAFCYFLLVMLIPDHEVLDTHILMY